MYQVTWVYDNRVQVITTPNELAAIQLFDSLYRNGYKVRLWDTDKTLIC
jgi:hypothetical protein